MLIQPEIASWPQPTWRRVGPVVSPGAAGVFRKIPNTTERVYHIGNRRFWGAATLFGIPARALRVPEFRRGVPPPRGVLRSIQFYVEGLPCAESLSGAFSSAFPSVCSPSLLSLWRRPP